VSSVLAVSTKRSAKQFALGYRGGIFTTAFDAGAGQDGIEGGGELAGTVADEEPECGGAVVEIHQQVPGLLGGPCSGRMARRPQYVDVAVADFERDEDVDPDQGDRAVDVEEVHGQHGRGLRAGTGAMRYRIGAVPEVSADA
jgi:hypothetical protein